MKKGMLIIFILFPSIAFAQYVSDKIKHQIEEDKRVIAIDQAEIAERQADIDNIINDKSADSVTADIPDVKQIKQNQEADIIG